MRKILALFLCLLSFTLEAQIIDDFSDANFIEKPSWTGDINLFEVNSSFQLQSKQTGKANTAHLVTTSSSLLNTQWEFYIKLQLNPSDNNQMRIYLAANDSALEGSPKGYYIRIGESGNLDSYDLYRQNGSTSTKIIDGKPGRASLSITEARIRVNCTKDGEWTLMTDTTATGSYFITEGTVIDQPSTLSAFFGIYCKYSSTNSRNFFFDDLQIGLLEPDTIPPEVLIVRAIDSLHLIVSFSEEMDSAAAIAEHYLLNDSVEISHASSDSSDLSNIHLRLSKALPTGSHRLLIKDVKDLSGLAMVSERIISFSYTLPYYAKYHDVVINELLPDPSPQIELPGTEFVELFNTSERDISLKDWKYTDESSTYTFKNDSIKAQEYVILCSNADTGNYKVFGRTIGLSTFPSLNNSGDKIKLVSQNNVLIDSISYTDKWYTSSTKRAGGWTLERINPLSASNDATNFSASIDSRGGTPGRLNSLHNSNPQVEPLELLNLRIVNVRQLTLIFNQALDSAFVSNPMHYNISPEINIDAIQALKPPFTQVTLLLESPLIKGTSYQLLIDSIKAENGSITTLITQQLGIPLPVQAGDLIINEVLFNPKPNGVDFIEIYNRSTKIVDLAQVLVADRTAQNGIGSIKNVSDSTLLIYPEQYRVLSSNPDTVKTQYDTKDPKSFIKMALPGFNDDEDAVILLAADSSIIDRFDYSEKMHFSEIENPEGISLERIQFNIATNDTHNWHSAASTVGYASPGYVNSQNYNRIEQGDELSLSSKTFSPDNDGHEDILFMHYTNAKPGQLINLSIYTDQGYLVKHIARSELLGSSNTFIWDGLNEDNSKAWLGIYIVYVEVFSPHEASKTFRKTVVLAQKL